MTEEQAEHLLAEALEDYHRTKARGERPDEVAFRERLGPLYGEFMELVAAETLIDEALEPAGDESHLPIAWGSYTLLREIARGAAGVVYEAIHRKLGRKVALKVLRTGVDTDANARERFQREAQALAHVKHDNIVEIYEFGEIDGRPYYAMSLVQGPSLIELVKQDKLPTPQDLCRGLAGVADALVTLHAAGIIHRDVKPQNIIVDESGRYMLADFGLARTAMSATMTRTGDALGTPLYMSPEQMLGDRKAVEERTDIYGLGATMYQLLTGVPPFKTDNLHALMRMVMKERPVRPRLVKPDLPAGCSQIAMKCLEKEPRDRYGAATELRRDLLTFADGGRVTGKPLTRPQRGLRLLQAHPILSAAAVVLLGFGLWALLKPVEPVSVSLRSVITPAQVKVAGLDGDYRDPGDLINLNLPPNDTYQVHIRPVDMINFREKTERIEVGDAGFRRDFLIYPKSPEGMAIFTSRTLKLDAPKRAGTKRHRGGRSSGPVFEVAMPRGRMRVQELTHWAVMISTNFSQKYPKGAWLAFYDGNTLLHEERFPEPDTNPTSGRIPEAVLKWAAPGKSCTWGLAEREGGKPLPEYAATFTLARVDLDAVLAKIDQTVESTAPDDDSIDRELARVMLHAQVFLREGLPGSVLSIVQPVIEADIKADIAEMIAAENENRPQRPVPVRASHRLLTLKEEALLTYLPKMSQQERSLVWAEFNGRERQLHGQESWAAYEARSSD